MNIENCRRRRVQWMSAALVLVAAALLSGCAYLTPRSEPALAQSQALQSQQHQQAQVSLAQSSAPRLWFAGFALHSQSMAFQGDLDAAHALFTRQFPSTIALRFSNELQNRSASESSTTSRPSLHRRWARRCVHGPKHR